MCLLAMIPQGKGIFIWQIKQLAGGDANAITGLAKAAKLTHVLIKVADGKYSYNITNGVDMVPGLVASLRSHGIQAWGWQYIYGRDPIAEAKKGIERVKQFALDGFVVNAEKEFKADGMDKVAKKYMEDIVLEEKDDQGNITKQITGMSKILDPVFLEEVIQYNEDGNFDRLISFELALALANKMDPIYGKVRGDADPRVKAIYSKKKTKTLFLESPGLFKNKKRKLFT